jgi:hypothetical protein
MLPAAFQLRTPNRAESTAQAPNRRETAYALPWLIDQRAPLAIRFEAAATLFCPNVPAR